MVSIPSCLVPYSLCMRSDNTTTTTRSSLFSVPSCSDFKSQHLKTSCQPGLSGINFVGTHICTIGCGLTDCPNELILIILHLLSRQYTMSLSVQMDDSDSSGLPWEQACNEETMTLYSGICRRLWDSTKMVLKDVASFGPIGR